MTRLKNKYTIISAILLAITIAFIIAVKFFDVDTVNLYRSYEQRSRETYCYCDDDKDNLTTIKLGFSKLNTSMQQKIPTSLPYTDLTVHEFTNYVLVIPIAIVLGYIIFGIYKMLKQKIDVKNFLAISIFYISVLAVCILFNVFVVNYGYDSSIYEAPIPSFPSFQTLIMLSVCGSSIIINRQLLKSKRIRILNFFLIILTILIVAGRFLSGVDWFTDIVGAVLISATLLSTFYAVIKTTNKK